MLARYVQLLSRHKALFSNMSARSKTTYNDDKLKRQLKKAAVRQRRIVTDKKWKKTVYKCGSFFIRRHTLTLYENNQPTMEHRCSLMGTKVLPEDIELVLSNVEWQEFTIAVYNKALLEIKGYCFVIKGSSDDLHTESWNQLLRERNLLIKRILFDADTRSAFLNY